MKRISVWFAVLCILAVALSGCTVGIYKRNPKDKVRIQDLSTRLNELEQEKEKEREKLLNTLESLRSKFKEEIAAREMKLEMAPKGLVITFIAEVLFDSGKADIRTSGKEVINRVVDVIKRENINEDIGIIGHTDNIPIKHSGYKSNWELSSARALSVLHYLESKGIAPDRLSATGYGEYRPVASNASQEGRQQNRRVEIIIQPKYEPGFEN